MPGQIRSTVTRPDGAALGYNVEGSGPPLLLISGLGGTGSFWRPVVDALAGRFSLITLDQRGIAASTRGTGPVTIGTLADDVAAVLDDAGVDDCIVVGHSTGGCIAMTLAARQPGRVRAAVLSATWVQATPWMTALFNARRALLATDATAYASLGAMLGYPPEWLEANWHVHEAAVRAAPTDEAGRAIVAERIGALLAFDGSELVGRLSMPCLVVGARDDQIVPLSAQRTLAERLPRSRLVAFETGGHFFPVTRTADFARQLAFVAGDAA